MPGFIGRLWRVKPLEIGSADKTSELWRHRQPVSRPVAKLRRQSSTHMTTNCLRRRRGSCRRREWPSSAGAGGTDRRLTSSEHVLVTSTRLSRVSGPDVDSAGGDDVPRQQTGNEQHGGIPRDPRTAWTTTRNSSKTISQSLHVREKAIYSWNWTVSTSTCSNCTSRKYTYLT